MKDNVDILLLAGVRTIEGDRLWEAIEESFEARQTHPIPMKMPKPPPGWERPFQRMAAEVQLEQRSIQKTQGSLKQFLNRVLSSKPIRFWDSLY